MTSVSAGHIILTPTQPVDDNDDHGGELEDHQEEGVERGEEEKGE